MFKVCAAVVAIVCLAAAAGVGAQGANKELAALTKLACTFPVSVSGSWKGGEIKADIKQGADVAVIIDEIDAEGGTAKVGPTHVTALLTQTSLHFMDRTMQGSLSMISVLSQKGPTGSLRAVRSRHDYLPIAIPGFVTEPNVSQHYGECTPE